MRRFGPLVAEGNPRGLRGKISSKQGSRQSPAKRLWWEEDKRQRDRALPLAAKRELRRPLGRRSQHRVCLVTGTAAARLPRICGALPHTPLLRMIGGICMKKDIKFSTRMASEDREAIKELAKRSDMSMSDYVTACCLGK